MSMNALHAAIRKTPEALDCLGDHVLCMAVLARFARKTGRGWARGVAT